MTTTNDNNTNDDGYNNALPLAWVWAYFQVYNSPKCGPVRFGSVRFFSYFSFPLLLSWCIMVVCLTPFVCGCLLFYSFCCSSSRRRACCSGCFLLHCYYYCLLCCSEISKLPQPCFCRHHQLLCSSLFNHQCTVTLFNCQTAFVIIRLSIFVDYDDESEDEWDEKV